MSQHRGNITPNLLRYQNVIALVEIAKTNFKIRLSGRRGETGILNSQRKSAFGEIESRRSDATRDTHIRAGEFVTFFIGLEITRRHGECLPGCPN